MAETVDYLLEHKKQYREQIDMLAHEYIYNLGCAAKAGADYIIKSLQSKVAARKEQG